MSDLLSIAQNPSLDVGASGVILPANLLPHVKLSKNLHSYKIHSKSSIDKFCSYTHICIKISLASITFLSLSLSHSHSLTVNSDKIDLQSLYKDGPR